MPGFIFADLGLPAEVWLSLSVLGCLTLFFKFSRFWSVRNLDQLLLFVLTPGLLILVGQPDTKPFSGFLLLFAGSLVWLVRSLIDLGLTRRPLLEPNLNAAGLTCLAIGMLGLLLSETITVPMNEEVARNPANPGSPHGTVSVKDEPNGVGAAFSQVIEHAPLPSSLSPNPPRIIAKKVLAMLAHLVIVFGLIAISWWHFDRPIAGLAMATCYLILPYTRIALNDSGQLIPAALIVAAIAFFDRPSLTSVFLGIAASWMPACAALLLLWAGFYRSRGLFRFAGISTGIALVCAILAISIPDLASWAKDLGARSLGSAGMTPGTEPPTVGSFWSGVDANFRLPVLIGYLAFAIVSTLWPARKNLGELISLSAALLIAGQFWYLDKGGAHVVLYLPLLLLMMYRPNLSAKTAYTPEVKPTYRV